MLEKIKSLFKKTTVPVQAPQGAGYKVLVIEDEGLISRMYQKKMELDGYKVYTAENGEQGLVIAKEVSPDIIMCDVMMPSKDGISTLKDLKMNPTLSAIPVIMLSNLSDEKYVQEALGLGAASYLVKSQLVPAQVVAKLKEVLEASGKKSLVSQVAQVPQAA